MVTSLSSELFPPPKAMPATSRHTADAEDVLAGAPRAERVPDAPETRPGAAADDWVTAAVVFGIIGGCCALWVADLSLVTGMLAAVFSGLLGVLFADI